MDAELFARFEEGINPRRLEQSRIPARVLGFGEMSTVLEIDGLPGYACKRMPMFKDEAEAARYEELYLEYIQGLEQKVGLSLPPSQIVRVADSAHGRVVLFILQQKLAAGQIGNHLIYTLEPQKVHELVLAIIQEGYKVYQFNRTHEGELAFGLDMQISNWAVAEWAPGGPPRLLYFDTSTPLIQRKRQEQQNPELFLRSAPSMLRWVIRLFFLQDVLTRYYDFRKVIIDLLANFYKEQRAELVPALIETINDFLAKNLASLGLAPLTEKEVQSYYQEDALIWRVYLAFRKFDRWMSRLSGKEYPYILPERIVR